MPTSINNQYINIYKTTRLSVFKQIPLEADESSDEDSSIFSNYDYLTVPKSQLDQGYMSDQSPAMVSSKLNPLSTVFKPTIWTANWYNCNDICKIKYKNE